ncbi:methyltransferase domain-containing protein [Peribacillus saganii]|uniref:Methyltransferase domain-containing protein n=1 Tax=Peribacillus saganii TaxID=2303992 RepID=A0A372LMT8_9BACI|nr:class I SAM-dependent methyltransferase [Peribacillus saganii]RFU68706.1 methyltransferase domain-containing protein [Peribacillus saganii]
MKLDRILPFARLLLQNAVCEGNIAVDGTMGNGHDTEFLANLVGDSGHIYGFDIQERAITETSKRLKSAELDSRCTLFLAGHEQIKRKIPEQYHGQVTGAIFNLGYLPGGDKSIVTTEKTTIEAIEQLLDIMAPEGIIVLVIYHGHPGGAVERDAILDFTGSLPQERAHVLQYRFINQANNPPFIVAIEKRQ